MKKQKMKKEKAEEQTKDLVVSEKKTQLMENVLLQDPVEILIRRVAIIQRVYKEVMKPDIDYGLIPGCGDKPALLKPGTEKLVVTLSLCLKVIQEDQNFPDGHLNVKTKVEAYDKNGNFLGDGIGSCSTMESKFRYRNASRKCPACGKDTIIKGKREYGGGWICFSKKGGCGAKFDDDDQSIIGQVVGRIENPDIADQYNTVRKISAKRGRTDCVLSITGVSDIFTQDIEENLDPENPDTPKNITPENKKPNTGYEKAQTADGGTEFRSRKPVQKSVDTETGEVTTKPHPLAVQITALKRFFEKLNPGVTSDKQESLWADFIGDESKLTAAKITEYAKKISDMLAGKNGGKK